MKDEITGRFQKVTPLENGNYLISFEVEKKDKRRLISVVSKIGELFGKGKELLSITLSEHREKRSLNANSYLWVLLQKIGEATHTPKEEVYLKMLQRYSRSFTEIVVMPDEAGRISEAVERLKKQWRTTIELGAIKVGNITGIQVQCYYGSSTFDTKEMSVLIDGVVSECKELGIETMTPAELSLLCEEWGK